MTECATTGRAALEPGDTITWTARNGTRSWGIVDYTDDDGIHVKVRTRTGDHPRRYLIRWDKVTGHHQGRAEHDRHM